MVVEALNTTGWNELINGSLIGASFKMYDTNFGAGWVVVLLLITYQVMMYLKSKNVLLTWATSAMFISLAYGTGLLNWASTSAKASSIAIFAIMVFELAFILYSLVIKRLV